LVHVRDRKRGRHDDPSRSAHQPPDADPADLDLVVAPQRGDDRRVAVLAAAGALHDQSAFVLPLAFCSFLNARTWVSFSGESMSATERGVLSPKGPAASRHPGTSTFM